MRPTLRQLQYLVAVADTGKFGEAAKRMNVSQPSLSAQMADMEAYLSVSLIERGRRGAVLTPLGAEFVARARLILRQVEELKSMATQGEGVLAGRIRLGVLPTIGPYLLPVATRQLHGKHPDLRLTVNEMSTINLAAALRDGRLDTIISTPEDHPDMDSIYLFHEELWICAADDDPLSDGTGPVQLSDLKGRPLLSLGAGHRLSFIVEEIAHRAGAFVSAEYEGTSLDATRQMAIMGGGVAILPSLYALSEATRDPDLKIRKIESKIAERDIHLCWRPSSPLTKKFQVLGETMAEVADRMINSSGSKT